MTETEGIAAAAESRIGQGVGLCPASGTVGQAGGDRPGRALSRLRSIRVGDRRAHFGLGWAKVGETANPRRRRFDFASADNHITASPPSPSANHHWTSSLHRPRPLLRRRRLPYRSLAPGCARGDHACAFRPRALRIGCLCLPSRHGADPAQAPRRRRDRDRSLRRNPDPQRRRDVAPSGGPRAGLGANPRRADAARSGSPRATTSSRATACRRPSSPSAATPSSPSRPSACRSTAGARKREHSPRSTPGGARTSPPGRASVLFAYALGKAQRVLAHVDAAIGPIVCHGAVEAINALYREAGVALPPTRLATRIDEQAGFRARPHSRAAVRRRKPVAQALRRLFRRAGERLDAGARKPPAARARPRLCAVRPRRLAGPDRRHRGDWGRARSGHAWLYGAAGAIPARAGSRRARAQDGLWRRRGHGRRRSARKARRQRRRARHEGLRRALPETRFRRPRPAPSRRRWSRSSPWRRPIRRDGRAQPGRSIS